MKELKRISGNVFTYKENFSESGELKDLKAPVFFLDLIINKFIAVGDCLETYETVEPYLTLNNKIIVTVPLDNETKFRNYVLRKTKLSSEIEKEYDIKSNLKPFELRVVEEEMELFKKMNCLHAFLFSDSSYGLEEKEFDLLTKQLEVMNEYREVLNERIDLFLTRNTSI